MWKFLVLYAACAATAFAANSESSKVSGCFIGTSQTQQLQEMFSHPREWAQSLQRISGVILSQGNWHNATDAELRLWFSVLKDYRLRLELEVPVIKEWSSKGAESFAFQKRSWERIENLGGRIYSVAMDEPLLAATRLNFPMSYAVRQTVQFITAMRAQFPSIVIGDIEPYPSISLKEHEEWLHALRSALRLARQPSLDFYRLDPDWNSFDLTRNGNWSGVRDLEEFAHRSGLQFSLIYWAADYGEAKKRGNLSDSTWFTETMHQGYAYQDSGGAPDQFVVESWGETPEKALPETKPFTFTFSILRFISKFVH